MELTLKQKSAFGIGAVGKDMVYALSASYRGPARVSALERMRGQQTHLKYFGKKPFLGPLHMISYARMDSIHVRKLYHDRKKTYCFPGMAISQPLIS